METAGNAAHRDPWNKGKIVGQKTPFKLKDIWALRVRFQYARILGHWVDELGLDRADYGTHDAKDEGDADLPAHEELRALQLLLGHSKLESTVRYLCIHVDDALEISEQTEI